MTFKNHWEKTDHHFQIDGQTIQEVVRLAFPNKTLLSSEMISGGCANLNVKLILNDNQNPRILRIYLRDKDAAYREQKLAQLLKPAVPAPEVTFIGDYEEYHYTIIQYLPGISLRDFLLNHSHESMHDVMFEAGQILGAIQSHHFPRAGFFDEDLKVSRSISRQSYLTFAGECLTHTTILNTLGPEALSKIRAILEKFEALFPDEHQTHLVHGDYDPANILVDKIEGRWKITGILDWEFAFSGSWLQDVANMLRYAHQMPPLFKDSFLEGLTSTGLSLPNQWPITVDLLNLLALLDLLVRSSPKESPKQCKDICDLIQGILVRFEDVY